MRAFELTTQYRVNEDLDCILSPLPWSRHTLTPDPSGLQTFAVAENSSCIVAADRDIRVKHPM